MPFDVFISHSLKDKATADAVCAKLEEEKVRCWIAPRDIRPGADWAKSIVAGLKSCKVMVLIFSSHSNNSQQVGREVKLAFEKGLTVMPFRIEDVMPGEDLEYYMTSVHWLDALTDPMERHIDRLATQVKAYLDATNLTETPTTTPVAPATPAAVSAPGLETPAAAESQASYAADASSHTEQEASTAPQEQGSGDSSEQFPLEAYHADGASNTNMAGKKPGKVPLFLALALLIAGGAVAGWWFGIEQPKRRQQVAAAEKQKADIATPKTPAEVQTQKDHAITATSGSTPTGDALAVLKEMNPFAERQRRIKAQNDEEQIVTAIKNYFVEYEKYPVATTGTTDTYFGGSATAPAGSSLGGSNDLLFDVLRDNTASPVNSSAVATLNPRGIVFLDVPSVNSSTQPVSGVVPNTASSSASSKTGAWYDPWGYQYNVLINTSYNNVLNNPYSDAPGGATLNTTVIVWTHGKNDGTGTAGVYKDSRDVISWQ